ncbi:MAG: acyltransferase [Chitinophagaceae bacterium]
MEKQFRIAVLDGWRALSVLCVIMGHLIMQYNLRLPFSFNPFKHLGIVGVYIFFFISGYIISRNLIIEYQCKGTISIAAFFVRRIFRIIPPFVVYILGLLLIVRSGLVFSQFDCIKNFPLFFISDINNGPRVMCGWYLAHLWTLITEEQFYIIFPFIFRLVARWRASVFFAILYIAIILLIFLLHKTGYVGWAKTLALAMPIILGVTVANNELLLQKYLKKIKSWAFYMILIITLVLYLLPQELYYFPRLIFIAFPLTALLVVYTIQYDFGFSAFLSRTPILLLIGRVSYGMYLWQQVFTYHYSLSVLGYCLLVVSFIGIVLLSYHFVEKPLIAVGRSFSHKILNGNIGTQSKVA